MLKQRRQEQSDTPVALLKFAVEHVVGWTHQRISLFQRVLQALGPTLQPRGYTFVPQAVFSAFPYAITVVVLVVVSVTSARRRLGAPAALGTPYVREER